MPKTINVFEVPEVPKKVEERRIIPPKEEEVPPAEGRWLPKKTVFLSILVLLSHLWRR